jgi:hypothetical protein
MRRRLFIPYSVFTGAVLGGIELVLITSFLLLCLVAAFIYANIYFILGIVVLLVLDRVTRSRRIGLLKLWCMLALVALGIRFYDPTFASEWLVNHPKTVADPVAVAAHKQAEATMFTSMLACAAAHAPRPMPAAMSHDWLNVAEKCAATVDPATRDYINTHTSSWDAPPGHAVGLMAIRAADCYSVRASGEGDSSDCHYYDGGR